MAEFAAASSAAGLISLGLEVCSGLIKYCSAWKSYSKDHENTVARLKGLCNVLEVLDRVLQSSDLVHRPSFQLVYDNILACSVQIQELERLAEKLWTGNNATPSTLTRYVARAKYPMRNSELTSLNSTLDRLQSSLGLALQVAQTEQMSYMIAVNHSQQRQGLGQFSSMSMQMQSGSAIAETALQKMDEINSKINRLSLALQIKHSSADEIVVEQDCTLKLSADARHPMRTFKSDLRGRQATMIGCSCRSQSTSTSSWDLKFLRYDFEERSRHEAGCPMFRTSVRNQRKQIKICMPFFSHVTGYYLSLDVSIGAGGTTLDRRLACLRVMPNDSPCFKLFDHIRWTEVLTVQTLLDLRKSLSDMFLTGELYPNDVNTGGESLLHKAVELIFSELVEISVFEAWALLVQDIIDAGTAINHQSGYAGFEETPTDCLLTTQIVYPNTSAAFALLLNQGADPGFSELRHQWRPNIILELSHFAKDLNLSPFYTAILNKSQPDLERVIRESPWCIHEILPEGRSGLHAAADWPNGLQLLITAGVDIDQEDSGGSTPVMEALILRNALSVETLLESDCALASSTETFALALDFDDDLGPARGKHLMSTIITDAMADRRRRLKQLALEHLPADECLSFNLYTDSVLDSNAFLVQTALVNLSISIPTALRLHQECRQSLYHCVKRKSFNIDTADYLWHAGFHDTHAEDAQGGKPYAALFTAYLGHQADVESVLEYITRQRSLLEWFISRNDSEVQRWMSNGGQLEFASSVAILGLFQPGTVHSFIRCLPDIISKEDINFFSWLFGSGRSNVHSSCQCACSSGGCRPLDRYIRVALEDHAYESRATVTSYALDLAKILAHLLDTASALWLSLCPSIIRSVSFEWLGMDHTCCTYDSFSGFEYRNPSKTQEILYEQAEVIERFEDLLPEVVEEFWASGMDLLAYLEGPLADRVDEILASQYESDDEYVESVFQSTGVRLNRDCED